MAQNLDLWPNQHFLKRPNILKNESAGWCWPAMSLSALNLLGICLVDRAVREWGSSSLFLFVDCSAASWEENDDRNTWAPYRYPLWFLKNRAQTYTTLTLYWNGSDTILSCRYQCALSKTVLFTVHLFTAPKICEYLIIYGVGIAKTILQKTNEKEKHICRQIFPKCSC